MSLEIEKKEIELNYDHLEFKSVSPSYCIIGQDKALGLLRLGLSMSRPGYNIFVSGDDGSGRLTAIKEEIKKIEGDTSYLFDVAYLHNQSHHDRPICFCFPKGKAREFQSDLDNLSDNKTTKEELIEKWKDSRLVKFIKTLPRKEDNPWAWKINIILDRSKSVRRPMVIESHPSHQSLFGYVEKDLPPHLSVRAGSYQEAAGGFLIINAEETVDNEELWPTLKRYLEMTQRSLSSTAVQGEMMSSIRPYPIPLLTKVILLGSEEIYDKLTEEDDAFLRFFKVSPQFDYSMPADDKNINGTVSYLKKTGENLTKQDDSAYREILRYSAFLAEDRTRLSTQLSLLGDLLEEADLDAKSNNNAVITDENVRSALDKRDWYSSMAEEHINSEIKDGTMVMALDGEKIGVVNGLAVMDRALRF